MNPALVVVGESSKSATASDMAILPALSFITGLARPHGVVLRLATLLAGRVLAALELQGP